MKLFLHTLVFWFFISWNYPFVALDGLVVLDPKEIVPPCKDKQHPTFKVIGVKDGDTFVVLMDGVAQTVRFAHIDCPEKKQPFGQVAKQLVADLCFGTYVSLILDEDNLYDRNQRLIAEVILEDGSNLNKLLVANGLAWHFKKYSNSDEYAQLEVIAQRERRGLWQDPNPIPPWFWRNSRK